ncbi:SDR family NAD(P)-dependent oxidoreductase [Belnapia sp. T6]|uniref:SDR family NAD(P)-dependent oxidoreductase n=1 Tax=Belnapia mucosa TaxID=2804532 RepID=A0ABS1V1W0_9PROT|nr:SDR family NAD(P)-dependent oxidoreductase [Belnapia mucosa]MBL6454654.1 SDR family NAD(P)-dependent oxidoreductase [Belnapia mucosa]
MSPSPIALVTGASAGIGAVYAERLARRGHDLILVARSAARLEALAARLRDQTGRRVEPLPADLRRREDLLRVEHRLREDRGIAMLVNNAGIALAGPVVGADPERLEAMVQLNILAAMRLGAAAAAGFKARGAGTLVNVASVLALAPERFNGGYAGSKAFVLAFTQSLAAELQGSGVRVQAVLPGATRTAIWEGAGVDLASLPPEMLMEPEEMVDAALAGLDAGELVTIPSLPDAADWERMDAARLALGPNLSRNRAAARYLGR